MTMRMRRRQKLTSYGVLEPRKMLATLFAETFEAFTGSGFAPSPAGGQLDSDQWRATGLSDGDGVYGGTHDTGDFARGVETGAVSGGGVYAFNVGGNVTLGAQPTGADMTPGAFGLKVDNSTGASVDQFTISYDLWYFNDGERSNSFDLSYSTDDASYTSVAALDFSTPEASDSNGWTMVSLNATIDVTVAASSFLYFQWDVGDNTGSGNRDQIGIDNLTIETDGGGIVTGSNTLDLRFASYNVENKPHSNAEEPNFRTIFQAIGLETKVDVTRPIDLLALQETDVDSSNRIESIFDSLYTDDYSVVLSTNSSGDFFGFVYNTATLSLLESEIVTGPYTRDPLRGLFKPVGSSSDASNFYAYSVHLNATNSGTRNTETNALRADIDGLGSNENVILLGDLNIDSSSEASYENLMDAGVGQLIDPINSPGNWNNNNAFKAIHTQDPSGQMDDRFDFQLINDDVLAAGGLEYIPGSYRAFGNNGTHNINQQITSGSGASSAVLSALANASDHLPVVVDYRFEVASVGAARLFYNDSSFDGSDDLDSVATDKAALLPGQTATFENYTSYTKGINGIVLNTKEFAQVPTLATVSQFFEFRVGNDDAVGSWAAAPSPNGLTVQTDVDADGTDLIFLTWADNAIDNIWLQVVALANSETGLIEPGTFYFGNVIGETGNDPANARVNLLDVSLTRSNQTGFSAATIDDVYDFDRSGRVNLLDVAFARTNQTGFTDVKLITPPSSAPGNSSIIFNGGSGDGDFESEADNQFLANSFETSGIPTSVVRLERDAASKKFQCDRDFGFADLSIEGPMEPKVVLSPMQTVARSTKVANFQASEVNSVANFDLPWSEFDELGSAISRQPF